MTRLLLTVTGEPDRVAIVEDLQTADRLWAAWCRLRYARGKPMGGAVIDKAMRCACGGWARWFLGQCERCLALPDWRDDPAEQAKFEAEAIRRGWTRPDLAKASGA